MTTDLVGARNTEKRPYLCEKCSFGKTAKNAFYPRKHKFAKRLISILERDTFLFAQLFPVVARTWLELRSGCFFLPKKIRISARKSVFSYGNLFFALKPG